MIKFDNLSKSYGKKIVLKDINYSFNNKGISIIMGPSGAGKSTILNLIAGFNRDYSGEIKIENLNLRDLTLDELAEYREKNIGFVFQNYNLLTGYTVLENIMIATGNLNSVAKEDKDKVIEIIKELGILEKLDEKIENLSGGQKQRVAIARALINNPKIILADEPTGALDKNSAEQIMSILKKISKDRLVIIITHDKKVSEYGDEVLELIEGDLNLIHREEKTPLLKEDINSNLEEVAFAKDSKKQKKKKFVKSLSWGNFKKRKIYYGIIILSMSLAMVSIIASMNFNKIVDSSIKEFTEKNIAFNNGFIKVNDVDDEILNTLKNNDKIIEKYYQYDLNGIKLNNGDKVITLDKVPTPKSKEKMIYGSMPKQGAKEIALSASIAAEFSNNMEGLLGEKVKLQYKNKEGVENDIDVIISGIYSASYKDYFLSSDIEKSMFLQSNVEKPSAISYDVKNFEDVITVSNLLNEKGIKAENSAKEVESFLKSFESLERLFLVISIFILTVGLIICIFLFLKLSEGKWREIALLSALGYKKKEIKKLLKFEAISIAVATSILTIMISFMVNQGYKYFLQISITTKAYEIIILIIGSILAILLITSIINRRLFKKEISEGLMM